MLGEIRRFAAEGPTAQELASAKDFLVGNFALRFDSSQKIARNLLQFQLDDLGIDYIERRNDLIRAVTIDDIRRVAKRIYGGPVSVVTVGPGESYAGSPFAAILPQIAPIYTVFSLRTCEHATLLLSMTRM